MFIARGCPERRTTARPLACEGYLRLGLGGTCVSSPLTTLQEAAALFVSREILRPESEVRALKEQETGAVAAMWSKLRGIRTKETPPEARLCVARGSPR